MPHKDPEARRVYLAKRRAYYQAHKQEILAARKTPEGRARGRDISRAWRINHPDRVIEQNQRNKAKREQEYAAHRERMAGRSRPDRCECCGRPPGKKALHYDHSHQKGHFRGWLCKSCNIVLGLVDDDPAILRKLIAYLERNRVNTSPQFTLSGI